MQTGLAELTVLVDADRIAALYAGKILADLGARVTRLEWGSATPIGDRPGTAVYRNFLQASWRSLALDPRQPASSEVLGRLLDHVDIVLIDEQSGTGPLGAVYSHEHRAAVVRVSDYGHAGAATPANEFTLQAEGGVMTTHDGGVAGPVGTRVEIGEFTAGITTALAALVGALRLQVGMPAPVADVSVLESLWSLMPYPSVNHQIEGSIPFMNPFRVVPSIEPAADGLVCIVALSPPQWRSLVQMSGDERLADPRFAMPPGRLENRAEVEKYLREYTTAHTVDELIELGAQLGVPIARVARIDEVPDMAPYKARGVFTRLGDAIVPTNPFRIIGRERNLTIADSPQPGEGGASTLAEAGFSKAEIYQLQTAPVRA